MPFPSLKSPIIPNTTFILSVKRLMYLDFVVSASFMAALIWAVAMVCSNGLWKRRRLRQRAKRPSTMASSPGKREPVVSRRALSVALTCVSCAFLFLFFSLFLFPAPTSSPAPVMAFNATTDPLTPGLTTGPGLSHREARAGSPFSSSSSSSSSSFPSPFSYLPDLAQPVRTFEGLSKTLICASFRMVWQNLSALGWAATFSAGGRWLNWVAINLVVYLYRRERAMGMLGPCTLILVLSERVKKGSDTHFRVMGVRRVVVSALLLLGAPASTALLYRVLPVLVTVTVLSIAWCLRTWRAIRRWATHPLQVRYSFRALWTTFDRAVSDSKSAGRQFRSGFLNDTRKQFADQVAKEYTLKARTWEFVAYLFLLGWAYVQASWLVWLVPSLAPYLATLLCAMFVPSAAPLRLVSLICLVYFPLTVWASPHSSTAEPIYSWPSFTPLVTSLVLIVLTAWLFRRYLAEQQRENDRRMEALVTALQSHLENHLRRGEVPSRSTAPTNAPDVPSRSAASAGTPDASETPDAPEATEVPDIPPLPPFEEWPEATPMPARSIPRPSMAPPTTPFANFRTPGGPAITVGGPTRATLDKKTEEVRKLLTRNFTPPSPLLGAPRRDGRRQEGSRNPTFSDVYFLIDQLIGFESSLSSWFDDHKIQRDDSLVLSLFRTWLDPPVRTVIEVETKGRTVSMNDIYARLLERTVNLKLGKPAEWATLLLNLPRTALQTVPVFLCRYEQYLGIAGVDLTSQDDMYSDIFVILARKHYPGLYRYLSRECQGTDGSRWNGWECFKAAVLRFDTLTAAQQRQFVSDESAQPTSFHTDHVLLQAVVDSMEQDSVRGNPDPNRNQFLNRGDQSPRAAPRAPSRRYSQYPFKRDPERPSDNRPDFARCWKCGRGNDLCPGKMACDHPQFRREWRSIFAYWNSPSDLYYGLSSPSVFRQNLPAEQFALFKDFMSTDHARLTHWRDSPAHIAALGPAPSGEALGRPLDH